MGTEVHILNQSAGRRHNSKVSKVNLNLLEGQKSLKALNLKDIYCNDSGPMHLDWLNTVSQ